jgi:hypothetical protein
MLRGHNEEAWVKFRAGLEKSNKTAINQVFEGSK